MPAAALVAGGASAILAALFAVRAFIGPTLHDRALAAQCVAVACALVIAALATAAGRPDWIDAAIVIALAVFVALAAAAKFLRYRSFQAAPAAARGAGEGGAP